MKKLSNYIFHFNATSLSWKTVCERKWLSLKKWISRETCKWESYISRPLRNYLRFWHIVQTEFGINQTCSSFWHVTLIGNETRAAEEAGAAQPVQPLHPLGVKPPVRLLVLGLEDADCLPLGVLQATPHSRLRSRPDISSVKAGSAEKINKFG